jgi:hypothetical protein
MPDYKEALLGLLSAAYQMDEQGVASLHKEDGVLVDDAIDRLKALDEAKVVKLRGDVEALKKEQFQFGERRASEKWEKAIKAHGVKSETLGPKLLDEFIAAKAAKPELTDEVVKTLPIYRDLESKYTLAVQEQETKVQEAIKARDAEFHRERTLSEVTDYAYGVAQALKPVGLPKDPTKARAFLSPVFEALKTNSYQVQKDDNGKSTFLPLKADGGRLEDKHGHQKGLDALVTELVTSIYDIEQGEQRSSMGNPDKGTNKAITVELPKDPNERADFLFKVQRDPTIPKEKVNEILKAAAAMT